MLAFAEMLKRPAEKAGIAVPPDLENYDKSEFPHWHVYRSVQLGASMPHSTAAWDNAEVIAGIPADELKTMTYQQLLDKGFAVGFTIP